MEKRELSKMNRRQSIVLIHIFIFCLIALLAYIKFPCPFKVLFGLPCPACGTLHALSALTRFNLYGYIRYNYLAVPMISVAWLGIHKGSLFKNDKTIDIMTYIVCVLVIIRYCCEIFVDIFVKP